MRTLSLTIFLVAVSVLIGVWASSSGSKVEGTGAFPDAAAPTAGGALAGETAALIEPDELGGTQRSATAVDADGERAAALASPDVRTILSGRVLDERGEPLARAEVSAQRDSRDLLVVLGAGEVERSLGEARTGADGRFRIELDASNALRLSVEADGYAPFTEKTSAHVGQEKDLGDLVLDRGVILAGRVFDGGGAPVAGVDVFRPRANRGGLQFLGRVSGEVVATTDAEGRFRLARQAVGPWSLQFHSDAHPDGALGGVTDRPGDLIENLVVVLDDGFSLEGRVTGVPQGELESLLVRASEPREQHSMVMHVAGSSSESTERERTATIAADGTFHVRGLTRDKQYALVVRRDTPYMFTARSRSDTVLAQAGERGIVIAYDAGSTLTFQVVDKRTKAPLEEFTVRAGIQWASDLTDDTGSTLRRHPEGVVRYGNLRPKEGDTAQLELEAVGYALLRRDGIVLAADGDIDLGVIELSPVPVLRVHVTDRATGDPLGDARLTLAPPRESPGGGRFTMRREVSHDGDTVSMPGQESHRGRTAADGWASVTSFPGKTCALIVNAEGFARLELAGIELPAKGDHEVRVELGEGAEVRVTVVDTAGEPVAGARVEHKDSSAPPTGMLLGGGSLSERTDVHGVVHYKHLAPGSHAFRIDESNESGGAMFFATLDLGGEAPVGPGWDSVAVVDGEEYELTLVAPGRGLLSGIIREDGGPLASAVVSVSEKHSTGMRFAGLLGSGPRASTDSQGRYEVDDLKPGVYTLSVTHSMRAMPYEAEIVVVAGPNEQDADLPVSIVEGRVFDEHGDGITGASVRISRRESGSGPSRGNFVIAIADSDGDGPAIFSDFGAGPSRTETDEQGRYRLRGVAAQTDLYVEARAEGYEPITSKDFSVEPGELRTGVDVHLDKGGTIVVRMTGDAPEGLGLLARARFVGAPGAEEEPEEIEPALGVLTGGQARLEGLKRGNWEVSLESVGESDTDLPEPKTVEVRPDEESVVEFEG